MLQHQAETYTREMLLDAEWISWGRYYRRNDPVNGNKYWDDQGNEITAEESTRRSFSMMELSGGKEDKGTRSERKARKREEEEARNSHPRSVTRGNVG